MDFIKYFGVAFLTDTVLLCTIHRIITQNPYIMSPLLTTILCDEDTKWKSKIRNRGSWFLVARSCTKAKTVPYPISMSGASLHLETASTKFCGVSKTGEFWKCWPPYISQSSRVTFLFFLEVVPSSLKLDSTWNEKIIKWLLNKLAKHCRRRKKKQVLHQIHSFVLHYMWNTHFRCHVLSIQTWIVSLRS